MKLYRSISIDELAVLLEKGFVEPRFQQENPDSSYRQEMGPVTCWFGEEIAMPWTLGYEFVVIADFPDDAIIGKGVGEYWWRDPYGNPPKSKTHAEYYTRGYSLGHISEICFRVVGQTWDVVVCYWWREFCFWVEDVLGRKVEGDILDAIAKNQDVFLPESEFYSFLPFDREETEHFFHVWGTLSRHTEKLKKIQNDRLFFPVVW
ncbi:hypothetical protein QT236_14445 [Geobacillus stearothermophilus]|nr:hypothetical protein QT236_14445 [Geobacillus stearothermophilus]